MKKRKQVIEQNYLEKIPVRPTALPFTVNKKGIVTLEIENKGVFNRLAQWILKKPKISYVHLDAHGSFVWQLIDGEKSILALAQEVDARFGEEAHPLYERIAMFFKVLDSYGFIQWQ